MASTNPETDPVQLPPDTRLGGVHLQVADLGRSLTYYTTVLGLRQLDIDGDSAMLGTPDSASPLVTLHQVAGTRPAPRRGAYGLFHFAILVPDRRDLGRLLGHLASHQASVGMADHVVSEAIYLTDPDGLGIEVYADRPRASWPRLDGQIAMATAPLDADDLIRAGGPRPWAGIPPGATMGHIHLHVGDLDRAVAFYHLTLGFDITLRTYPGGALFLSAGGYHHHLGVNVWSPGPAASADHARLLEWTLVLPDLADLTPVERRLLAAGYSATQEGPTRVTADPWGTLLRLRGSA